MQTPWRTPGNPELANTVHSWMPSDTEANWIGRGKPSIYDDTSFDYRYNELGWRCDSMADPLRHDHRVVWAGCSVTEGIGLPVEAVWGNHMTQRLRASLDDTNLPYWCVARGAASQDYVARQLSLMIPLLRPQVVVMHLPDPSRRELWWEGDLVNWSAGDQDREDLGQRICEIWDDDQIVHDSQRNIMMIHQACKMFGTQLHWHIWLHGDRANEIYAAIRRGLPDELQRCHYENSPGGGDVARDGMHGGPQTHADFASALWSEIGSDIISKLTNAA